LSSQSAKAALQRAAEISRELAAMADSGDVETVARLDALRLQLLRSARNSAGRWDPSDQPLLREIAELNNKAVGFMEHRRRLKVRDLEMVSVGRRAVRAYSANGR
jgi:hypothetical protein